MLGVVHTLFSIFGVSTIRLFIITKRRKAKHLPWRTLDSESERSNFVECTMSNNCGNKETSLLYLETQSIWNSGGPSQRLQTWSASFGRSSVPVVCQVKSLGVFTTRNVCWRLTECYKEDRKGDVM